MTLKHWRLKHLGGNESIIDGDEKEVCYLCGGKATDTHHIFEGSGRRALSDFYGLTVRLCRECHSKIHDTSCPEMEYLHRVGQRAYEAQIGTREMFINDFVRSYL